MKTLGVFRRFSSPGDQSGRAVFHLQTLGESKSFAEPKPESCVLKLEEFDYFDLQWSRNPFSSSLISLIFITEVLSSLYHRALTKQPW